MGICIHSGGNFTMSKTCFNILTSVVAIVIVPLELLVLGVPNPNTHLPLTMSTFLLSEY